jgi:hypothetical protein
MPEPEEVCAVRALVLAVEAALELAAEPRINRPELKTVLRLARDLAWAVDDAVHNDEQDVTDYSLE